MSGDRAGDLGADRLFGGGVAGLLDALTGTLERAGEDSLVAQVTVLVPDITPPAEQ